MTNKLFFGLLYVLLSTVAAAAVDTVWGFICLTKGFHFFVMRINFQINGSLQRKKKLNQLNILYTLMLHTSNNNYMILHSLTRYIIIIISLIKIGVVWFYQQISLLLQDK